MYIHHSRYCTNTPIRDAIREYCTTYCTGLYTIPPFGTPSGKECTEYCTELHRILTIVHNMYNPVHSIVHPSSFGTPSGNGIHRTVQKCTKLFTNLYHSLQRIWVGHKEAKF